MPRFYLRDHQGKGRKYSLALEERGHEWVTLKDCDFCFLDHDVGVDGVGFNPILPDLNQEKKPVFMYPHAGTPPLWWDMYPAWPHTKVCFVASEGHAGVAERFGHPVRTEVAGWSLCQIAPFQSSDKDIPHVLFGPAHPCANGYLWPEIKERNRQVYRALVRLLRKGRITLTVRHVKTLAANGLALYPGVKYVYAAPNQSTKEIDRVDVVFGHGTFSTLAIARGKPTVMFFETELPRSGNSAEAMRYAKTWDAYRDYLHYPFNFEEGETEALIQRAMRPHGEVELWKELFIGRPFDKGRVADVVEEYL